LTCYLRVGNFLAMEPSTVRLRLLEHAQTLIQLHGYCGFSFRDLSTLVGVKTSSIHYYFPAKEDLVLAAVNAYSSRVLGDIAGIAEALPANKKLQRYGKLLARELGEGDQICLCGMLSADIQSLPDLVRFAVQAFYSANENWLARVLEEGAAQGNLQVPGDPVVVARVLYAAYLGSVMSSRLFNARVRINEVTGWLKVL